MIRFVLTGCAAGGVEAALLLNAGQSVPVALLGYAVAGSIAMVMSAFYFAHGKPG